MGLAVLPARLKGEMETMREYILQGKDFSENESIAKHKAWFEGFKSDYSFDEDNTDDILKAEIGKTFVRVLLDAGVYKRTPEGKAAFMRFIDHING
jgi:UDPglucose--hexose-1-phosphate uridylyltransferase